MRGLFVTGTDTDVGKTLISGVLCKALSKHQVVTYFKPIQAGTPTDTDWVHSYLKDKIQYLEPIYSLKRPASPNRAADDEGIQINLQEIIEQEFDDSFYIVEGAGGLHVPINENQKIIDLIETLNLPTLLVASTRLGTINHTLLSIEALKNRGVEVLGIVLNGCEDPGLGELLTKQSGVPILFEVPKLEEVSAPFLNDFVEQSEDLRGLTDVLISPRVESGPRTKDLLELDEKYVWHPFTQHGIVKNHPLVTSGSGSYLNIGSHKVIDAISSWWVNLFGHSHPRLVGAIKEQAEKLEHVIFAGFTHEPAIQLSDALVSDAQKSGADLSRAFFSDNGSTSVEVALKMAFQYQQQRGQKQKSKFLAFRGSYHGDTLGAMSVGERKGFNEVFAPMMFDVDFVDPFDLSQVEQALEKNGDSYAGVILEPMVQGASGMRMYPKEVLSLIQNQSQQKGFLVICDEVFTGFYRTGKMFAFEHSDLKPDFLCLSKGLTGGFLPLAVTLTSEKIYQSFYNQDMRQAFLHGHSYTANPIACAVALESIKLLRETSTQESIDNIVEWSGDFLGEISKKSKVFNPRQLGTIAAFEINDEDPNYFKGDFSYRINQKALRKGVLLRPLGGTLYTVPPYCITKTELKKTYDVMAEILEEEF